MAYVRFDTFVTIMLSSHKTILNTFVLKRYFAFCGILAQTIYLIARVYLKIKINWENYCPCTYMHTYVVLLCPTIATTEVRKVVPKGTGMQEPSCRVSPTRTGRDPKQD